MARVNYITWQSGLNPYNYLKECFGGAPGPDGIYAEDETSVRMVYPGMVPMIGQAARDNYLEVSASITAL